VLKTSVATAVFFSLDLGFSVLSGVLGFLLKTGAFRLWSNFRNVCRITVFSIQEYSNFIGIICAESSVASIVSFNANHCWVRSVKDMSKNKF